MLGIRGTTIHKSSFPAAGLCIGALGPLCISELRMEERRTTSSEGGLLLAPPITLSKPDLTPFISVYKGVLLFLIQSTCFNLPHLHPPRAWREGEQRRATPSFLLSVGIDRRTPKSFIYGAGMAGLNKEEHYLR